MDVQIIWIKVKPFYFDVFPREHNLFVNLCFAWKVLYYLVAVWIKKTDLFSVDNKTTIVYYIMNQQTDTQFKIIYYEITALKTFKQIKLIMFNNNHKIYKKKNVKFLIEG